MDRETFEQLVSQWIDQPERADLRSQIDAAASESGELNRLKEEWLRLGRLLRYAPPSLDRVDWPRFQQRVVAAIEQDDADHALDETLRDLTAVGQRVDWRRLQQRISQAVVAARAKPSVIRFRLRGVAAGVAVLAAAAALVLMFVLPPRQPAGATGIALVNVSGPGAALGSERRGSHFVQFSVAAPADKGQTAGQARGPQRVASGPQLAEVFLMIEPIRMVAETRGGMTPLGFN